MGRCEGSWGWWQEMTQFSQASEKSISGCLAPGARAIKELAGWVSSECLCRAQGFPFGTSQLPLLHELQITPSLKFGSSLSLFFSSKLRIWEKVPRPWRQLGFLLLQYLSVKRILHLIRGAHRDVSHLYKASVSQEQATRSP